VKGESLGGRRPQVINGTSSNVRSMLRGLCTRGGCAAVRERGSSGERPRALALGRREPCKCSMVEHRDELIGRDDAGVWCASADERQTSPCRGREDDHSTATRRCATAGAIETADGRTARDLALRRPSSRPPASAVTPFSLPKSIPVRGDPNTSHPSSISCNSRIRSLHCADPGLSTLSSTSHLSPPPARIASPGQSVIAAPSPPALSVLGHVVQPAVHLHLLQGSRTLCPALSRPDALVGCNRRQLRPASKWG
jgi:hypothetical protein